jgi:hypothetical protein
MIKKPLPTSMKLSISPDWDEGTSLVYFKLI